MLDQIKYTLIFFIQYPIINYLYYNTNNTNIEFIKIDDNEFFNSGYKNSNCCIKKNPSAWDKVFYYFCKINKN